MRFSSCAFVLRVVLVGFVSAVSFVRALPALPNSDPGAKPASLLGRSYTRRTADSFAVSVFGPRQLGSEAPIDDPRPLGRAARFQISQHRASSTPGFVRADKGDETQSRDGQGSVEGREILLSHQQLVPSSASSLSSSSTTPVTPTSTSTPSLPPPSITPSSVTPGSGSRVAEKSKSKLKKTTTRTLKAKSKHSGHKQKATHESTE